MRTATLRRTAATTAGVLLASLSLSGCQGVFDLPLPGGAAQGSDVYRVTVDFRDVLDLVPQSAVKVNDVTVGAVDKITLDGWHAQVRLRIRDSVKLPDNAVAELRQTSLLGEKFVSLAPPTDQPPQGRLGNGDAIPLSRSGRNPEVEEVLGALSLILNGGGVAQLKTINVELTKAMAGRESDIRDAVHQLDTFIGGLDEQKADLVRALDGLDRLSATLAAQKSDIASAIDNLGPGLTVLADQRKQLTQMLVALSDLGKVGTRVINASKADTVANLKALQPTLTKLADAGANLPKALEMALTYPFPATATGAVQGDFTNLRITADLDLRGIIGNLKPSGGPDLPTLPTVPPLPSGLPSLPTLPSIPTPTISVPGGGGLPSISIPPLGRGHVTTPRPTPTPTCVANICLGAPPAGSAYDMNLAALMTRGWA
jgi:phospholipid/cholesterol/gamma-HCH transport system substrate-binding protein